MAAQQGIRQSSSGRTMLKNLIRMIPAVVLIAATINTASCNNNNGLLQQTGGGGGGSASSSRTATPTATATVAAAAFAFVTNYNDAVVSSFTRNTSTGALAHTGQVQAGSKAGPRGVVASPNGSFLYVANINDDNIYEFSINQTDGTLTPLATPSVSNGNATQPDELAMNGAGTLLWVTGTGRNGYGIHRKHFDRAAYEEKLDRWIQHSVRHRGASDAGGYLRVGPGDGSHPADVV